MQKPTKPWTTVQLEHQTISESPRKVIYRFSDAPERVYASMEQAIQDRSAPQEVPPLSEHDMANEIAIKDKAIEWLRNEGDELKKQLKEKDADWGLSVAYYRNLAGAWEKRFEGLRDENKLKSADAQKDPYDQSFTYTEFIKAVVKALGLPATNHKLDELIKKIENLVRWKKDALKVLGEWDRVLAYLSKSPDLTIGDNLSEKCLKFLQERDAFVRERNKLRVLLEKPVSK
jgi:hypothetical protein